MSRCVLITGVTGQDGSYLAERLLREGETVYGLTRDINAAARPREQGRGAATPPADPGSGPILRLGDLADASRLVELVDEIRPSVIYHFGAQSDAHASFSIPNYTTQITGFSTLRLLEAIRRVDPSIRLFQASSCELFGSAPPPQREDSPMSPQSPYAVAKLYAYHLARVYRQAHGLFCCSGILFNHESPRRHARFVSRKITQGVAQIVAGQQDHLVLGNLQARRDWGYAPEYVEVIVKLMRLDAPHDVVIGTGEDHSIAEFAEAAFAYVGLRADRYVRTDPRYVRRMELGEMRADTSLGRELLGWSPKITFEILVKLLMDVELHAAGLDMVGEGIEAVRRAGLAWSVADAAEWPATTHRAIGA